jgi:hypothetical protein
LARIAALDAAAIVEALPAEPSSLSETPAGAQTSAAHARPIDPAAGIDVTPPADAIRGWFDERELKLGTGDDKSDMFVDPTACVYPDAYLRSLAGGRDDCATLTPGESESETPTLPLLALMTWILVVCAVAALYHFHRSWRVRRWLHRMEAQGLVPSGTSSRRPPPRRRRRSSRQGRAGSRGYAG